MIKKIITLAFCIMFSGMFFSGSLIAQDSYPSKPIKVIVPYGAGGGTDSHTRMLQKTIEKYLPVPLVIVNMGGGAGSIGSREVLNADPDGYTMLINLVNIWTANFLGTADFGPFDLEPIAEGGRFYLIEMGNPKASWNNLAEYAAAAKATPGDITEATNIGAITHFTTLGLQEATGAQFNIVHIGDGAQRISNLLGGHIDGTIMGTHEAKRFIETGEMKALAVFADEKLPGFENVPTTVELGIDWVQAVPFWFFFPPGTPQESVDYMADVLNKTMNDPELKSLLIDMGKIPTFKAGEELDEVIREEGKKLQAIATKYDLKKN